MKRSLWVVALVLAVLAVTGAQAQQRSTAPAGTALVSGQVVGDGPQSAPIRLAFVTLSGSPLERPRTVVTSDDGAFRFVELPVGRFTLTARKVTYLDSALGALGPGEPGTPLVVQAGQQVTGLRLPLSAGAVITGTVRDGNAIGIPDALVMAVRVQRSSGDLTFRSGTPVAVATDDRGVYRLFGLSPDDYVVVTAPPGVSGNVRPMQARTDTQVDEIFRQLERRGQPGAPARTAIDASTELGRPRGYAPIYFPGTAIAAEADVVRLGLGEERGGIDVILSTVPTVTVTGTIAAPGGAMPPLQFYLQALGPRLSVPIGTAVVQPALYNSTIGADGVFKYTNVPPGQYRLGVRTSVPVRVTQGVAGAGPGRPPAEGESMLWGTTEFTVANEDVTGLSLTLQPALVVSGRIQFDTPTTATLPKDLTTLRLAIGTGGGSSVINGTAFGSVPVSPAIVRADGTFEFRGVVAGTYQFNVLQVPAGWTLRSVLADGRDLIDVPLDVRGSDVAGLVVRFTDRQAELYGTLQTAAADAASRYAVVALPVDRTLWRPGSRWIRLARPSSDGAFSIEGLPGGDYLMALLTNATTSDLERTDFLEQAAQAAIRVRIAEGARVRQDLRLGR